MTPRRQDVRPPRLGPPKRELAIGKANGRDEEVGVTRPTTPQTPPRRRPPKLGRPKAELECMKRTQFDDEARSATPDSPHDARRSQSRQPKADIESNEGGDGGGTPEGPHRRPPKLGHPKAGTIDMVLERKSVSAKLSTINTKLQSAEETRKQAPELDSGKAETSTMAPERGSAKIETSTTALALKNDEVETNTSTPHSNSPQGDARKAMTETNNTKAETTPALPESKSARAEPDGTSSDRSKAPDLKIEEAGGAVPDGPPSRLPKLGRPKAELESQGHSAKPETSVTIVQHNRGPAETSVTASNPSKAPELQTGEVGGVKPEGPRPRPRPKPPKLGRPKAEIDSQKPGKLPKEDERVTLKMPYIEHTKLGRTGAEPEPNETKSEQAPNEMDQEARDVTLEGSPPDVEGKSNHVNDGIPRELPTRPPKLGKPKAEPETTKLSNPAEKDVGAQESTPGKLKKAEPESKMIHFKQAPRDLDEVDKGPIPEASPPLEPTEIESTGSRARDTEPPAVGTKALKLGRPKAESEPTKPSKLTKNGKRAGNFTPGKPTKAKTGFKQIKPERTPRPTKDAIPPTGRARPPKPEKPKAEIESTELSYLTQKR